MSFLYQSIYFSTTFLSIALAALIFFKRPDEPLIQAFTGFILSIAGWIVTLYVYYVVVDPVPVLLIGRLNFVFAECIALTSLVFVFFLTEQQGRVARKWLIATGLLTAVLAIMTLVTDLLDQQEIVNGPSRETIFGPLYPAFPIHFIVLAVYGIVLLIRKYRSAGADSKKQILLFVAGWGFAATWGVVTNIILPPLTGNTDVQNLGPAGVIILSATTGYAVARQKLLNIQTLAAEFFVVFLMLLFVINIAASPSVIGQAVGAISLIFGLALGYALIRSTRNEVKRREEVQLLAVQLADANVHLKELDEAKSDFISIASHQLRTPVAIIRGYLSLMMEGSYGKLSSAADETVKRMIVANERLVQLINNLLNVSRIEKNKIEFSIAPFVVADLVSRTVEEMKLRAGDKGIELETLLPAKRIPPMVGDEGKLHEVLVNLIDNAIKYSRRGAIIVSVGSAEGGKSVIFRVKDSGIGLTKDQASKLFEKFYRVKSPSTATEAGTGLGLYICVKFVIGMGGRIFVEKSVYGKGTTFAVTLPMRGKPDQPGQAATSDPPPAVPQRSKRLPS